MLVLLIICLLAQDVIVLDRVSTYQAAAGQTDGSPGISACGSNLQPYVQIAVSRDLFARTGGFLQCGQQVVLYLADPLNGQHKLDVVVFDTMHPRYKKTVDVLTNGENTLTTGWLQVKDDK